MRSAQPACGFQILRIGGAAQESPRNSPPGPLTTIAGGHFESSKSDFVPTFLNQPRVKIFAAVNRGERDRAGGDAPVFVRADDFHRAVGVFEPDLRDGFLRAERAFEFGETPAAEHLIHAVAEFDADGIFAAPQIRRDVARVVKAGLVIFRPAGRKKIVANFFAVERHFVLAEAADIDERALESGLHGKFAAQQQRRDIRVRRADPFRLPVIRMQNAHRPRRRLAPRGNFSVVIPHAHFPENLLRRFQFFAGVQEFELFRPESTLPLSHKSPLSAREIVFRRRDENFISGLPLAARRCFAISRTAAASANPRRAD